MYHLLYCFINLFAFITAQADNSFVFKQKTEAELSKCIENEFISSYDPYYREVGISKTLADLSAKRFLQMNHTRLALF